MRSRVLAAALLAYLALDFANPLIPGAVSFVSGELDTVAGTRCRAPDTPPPIMVAMTLRAGVDEPLEWRAPSRPDLRDPVCVTPRGAARSSPSAPSGDETPSPDDD